MAVRSALEEVQDGASDRLRKCFEQWPEMVEAVLELERVSRPREVALVRKSLGLPVSPYRQIAEGLLRQWQALGDPSEQIFFAAELLAQNLPVLSAEVVALATLETSGSLIATMHAVAPRGNLRTQLAKILGERSEPNGVSPLGFVLNRECSAFHQGFLVDDHLVMVFREYPGHYLVFSIGLGVGVESVSVMPVSGERWIEGVLEARDPNHTKAHTLDDCRTLLAASISRLEDNDLSEPWRILGHLVEERLFPVDEDAPGFVVGDYAARTMLDRLARTFLEDDVRALESLLYPGSSAAVLCELFGPNVIRVLMGLNHGVERIDIGVESLDSNRARALMVGRSGTGQVLTRTRFFLLCSTDDWEIDRLEFLGVGERDHMLGPVWQVLSGEKMLPIIRYGDLEVAEQEIVAGFLDTGFRLDETASAISLLRKSDLVAAPGSIAAACHFVFDRLYIGDEPLTAEEDWDEQLTRLCDRYEGGLDEAAELIGRLEMQLFSGGAYKQYLVG
ncbi:MAG: hypothetical protein VX519_03075 [Myxococcota bacterium]|nr:hypothetical protein [Myxococcota bacterium]